MRNIILYGLRIFLPVVIIPLIWKVPRIAIILFLIWALVPLIQGMLTKKYRILRGILTTSYILYPLASIIFAIKYPRYADPTYGNTPIPRYISFGILIFIVALSLYEIYRICTDKIDDQQFEKV